MAKRRHYSRGAGTSGMLGQALKGIGAASVAGVFVGENPLVRAAAGYVGGKIPGAAGAFALAYLKNGGIGISTTPSSGSW